MTQNQLQSLYEIMLDQQQQLVSLLRQIAEHDMIVHNLNTQITELKLELEDLK